jgi:hypothetical protein
MKPKTKMLLLIFGLILPYMGFVEYRVLKYPSHPFQSWFPYAAICYFICFVLALRVGRKRIFASAVPLSSEAQTAQNRLSARAGRVLGYIFLIKPGLYLLSGGLTEIPSWITAVGFSWAVFLSWFCFHTARNIEKKARLKPDIIP